MTRIHGTPGWQRAARAAVATAAAFAALAGGSVARAATVTTCDPFGTVAVAGGTYTYQQDEWNSTATQCASVDNVSGAYTMTTANFNLATNGPPATYPSIYRGCHWGACTSGSGLPIQVSNLGSSPTSWSTTQPASGAYDVAYDIWFNTTPTTTGQPDGTELMIWLNSRGGVNPAGSQVATVTIAGTSWQVWTARMASWNYIAYRRVTGTTSVSNLDVRAFAQDAVSRGSLNNAWYLIGIEAGFEIWQGGQGLATTSFSASPAGGGTGGTDTQAPSVPANLRATGTTSSSVSLAWNASSDNVGVASYDVLRGGAVVGTTSGTSFTDSGLAASTTFRYTVRARDAAGNVSGQSTAVSATTQAGSGGGGGSLKVQYKNNDSAPGDNQIKPGLQLVDTGGSAVSLSAITIRYWFTRDGGASTFQTWCDFAVIGCGSVRESVVAVSPARSGADSYLQVSFTGGTLAAGASSGELQLRLNKTDWSAFNEVGDYSYATNTAFADSTRITVYQNGTLIWGTEPT